VARDIFKDGTLDIHYIRANLNGHEVVAGLQPNCGANLVSFVVDGVEYLHYDPQLLRTDPARMTGAFVMFPTPCRVRDGEYRFEGRLITQRKAGRLYTIHGLVRDEAFTLTASNSAARLQLDITPDHPVYEGFPFPGRLALTMQLADCGLVYTFSFHNRGERAAPVAFGLHPWWRIPGRREDVSITIPCELSMVADKLIPTGQVRQVAQTGLDFRLGRALDGLEVDAVLTGRTGLAPAIIEYRDLSRRLVIDADDVFSHQVVYTKTDAPFVCVESLTCAPNAVNLQSFDPAVTGFRVVQAGSTLSGTIRFTVEDT